jgi:hypothetical protein
MSILWQLKKISTGEPLNEPQVLPENWGPIFGMEGFKDKLSDLSWVGIEDQGWFIVGEGEGSSPQTTPKKVLEWERAKQLLRDSDWSMMSDVQMTNAEKQAWELYRKNLREITLQSGFPDNIKWPTIPETPKFNMM